MDKLKTVAKWLAVLIVIALLAGNNWRLSVLLDKQIDERTKTESSRSDAMRKSEDLSRTLSFYKPHEQLVKTIMSRDQAADTLWQWLGKRVRLKNDSSFGVVDGVFFGGSRFDHRIWVEVISDGGVAMMVNPELIQP